MQKNGDIEELEDEEMDAVNALDSFIEQECKIVIGMGVFVRKDEFQQRYVQFCKEHEVEPPSPGVLGSILVTCYRAIWGDVSRGDGGGIPVWRNLGFKDHEAGGS
jgi:hypothetical protein